MSLIREEPGLTNIPIELIRDEPGLTNIPIELIRKSNKDEKKENLFARHLTDPTLPTVDTARMLIGLP